MTCVILLGHSIAHSADALTLQQALANAYQSNPQLIATARGIGIADATLTQAGLIPNPELAGLTEGLHAGERTTTVQINQVIELGGKRSSRMHAARQDQDIAMAELSQQRAVVRADLIGLFFEVLNAQERLELADQSYRLAANVTDVVKRRVAAGRVSPIEATRASVAELGIKTEFLQAQTGLTLAKTRLAATWGETTPTFSEVAKPGAGSIVGNDASYSDIALLQTRLDASPQRIRAQRAVQRNEAQEEIERSRQIGDLTLSVGRKREEETGRNLTVVGVAVPIPLFDRNQGNLLGALRKTDQARDELIAIDVQLRRDLIEAYQRHQLAKGQLTLLQSDILPQAQSAIDATVKGFEFGKFNLLDILEAQNALVQAKDQYLQTQADLYRSIADIERIVGEAPSTGTSNDTQ